MTNILQVSQESIHADGKAHAAFLGAFMRIGKARTTAAVLRRKLDVAHAMEDIAFVLRDVEELTPTQTALVQVNANAAVAGTDDSASEVLPQQITMEEFKRSGFEDLSEAAMGFAGLWSDVRNSLLSVKVLNDAALLKLELLTKQLQMEISQAETLGLAIPEQTIRIDELPEILHINFPADDGDYLEGLATCRTNFNNKLRNSTVKCVTDLRTLVHDGMTIFKTSSATTALEQLKEHHRALKAFGKSIAFEDVKVSPDGLIIDVELSGGYAIGKEPDSDVLDLVEIEHGLDLAQEGCMTAKSTIWQDLLAEAMLNEETLKLSNGAIDTLACSSLEQEIEAFGKTAESILARLPVMSNTKEAVYGYCELFLDAVQIANAEVSFLIYMAHFTVAHTELLAVLAGKVKQTNAGV